jgi:hypothetical protein
MRIRLLETARVNLMRRYCWRRLYSVIKAITMATTDRHTTRTPQSTAMRRIRLLSLWSIAQIVAQILRKNGVSDLSKAEARRLQLLAVVSMLCSARAWRVRMVRFVLKTFQILLWETCSMKIHPMARRISRLTPRWGVEDGFIHLLYGRYATLRFTGVRITPG